MRRHITVMVVVGLTGAMVGVSNAAPPAPTGTAYQVEPSIRGSAGDVLLNDGTASYAGNDSVAYLYDSLTAERGDTFNFFPWRQRTFSVKTPLINDGTPVTCTGFSRISAFSTKTPQWFEELESDGSSILGDASVICATDNSGKQGFGIFYPETDPNASVDLNTECVRFTRVSATSYSFAAPADDPLASCKAAVYSFANPKGSDYREYTFIGYSSAPFEVTTIFDP